MVQKQMILTGDALEMLKTVSMSDFDCMAAIITSGESGITRTEIAEKINRHERNVRRSVRKLIKAKLIFVDSIVENRNGAGPPCEIIRAYREGINWLNNHEEEYGKMRRRNPSYLYRYKVRET